MSKLFFDFEFTGLKQNTTPISLGIVSDNGRSFYAEFTDFSHKQIESEDDNGEFIKENVLKNLVLEKIGFKNDQYEAYNLYNKPWSMKVYGDKRFVAEKLQMWLSSFDDQIELWGDCLAYDWVLFCDLFGHAFNIPSNVYYIPFDICTLFKVKGIDPDINREQFTKYMIAEDTANKHNSLYDAAVIKCCYKKLTEL